jgi:hypothetical protein
MAKSVKLSRSEIIIKRALAFPTDEIAFRYSTEAKISIELARGHATEVKKYLALCAIHPKTSYGMSKIVDGFWHVFIWHTVAYHQFCKNIAGRYIHHHPASADDKSSAEGRNAYKRTYLANEMYFGEEAPEKFWPSLSGICRSRVPDLCSSGCGSNCRSCRG